MKEKLSLIEAGIRHLYLFPETVAEVEIFEQIGNPDINFPVEELDFMFEQIMLRLSP